jgi:predicted TIM-barrel fold metal-dependent hydrolase
MRADDVSMEVLYPTYGLEHFRIADQDLQEACFRVYNDWLVEYCASTPGRLVGIASIPTYDINSAIAELERTHAAGLKGCEIWHVPPQNRSLSFSSDHYERLWDACEDLDAPVHLHITSGFVTWTYERGTTEQYRPLVEFKTAEAIHALFDFIFYGVLERHPRLKLVLVEFEIGWIPWVLQQWDYYAHRFANDNPTFGPNGLSLLPSEYFTRQVFTTFFNDAVGTLVFQHGWGIGNCMWSNDFPHFNSSWPNSRDVIRRDLGPLGEAERSRLVRENVASLYHLEIPSPIDQSKLG